MLSFSFSKITLQFKIRCSIQMLEMIVGSLVYNRIYIYIYVSVFVQSIYIYIYIYVSVFVQSISTMYCFDS